MWSTDLTLEGLHCASCVLRTEQALSEVAGVREATVNFATQSAHITHESAVTEASLVKAVEGAGYHASLKRFDTPSGSRPLGSDSGKLVLAAVLTVPAVALLMGWPMRPEWANWTLPLLTTPVVLFCGREFFVNAWRAAKYRTATMDTLVAIGAGVAWTASLASLLTGQGQLYFDSAAAIVSLILLGRRLESGARRSMTDEIDKLLDLSPKMASVVSLLGPDRQIPSENLCIGDRVRIRPGELAPTDGELSEGDSYFDESLITGEPSPVHRAVGDHIIGGAMNGFGSVVYRVTRPVSESRPAQIARLVEQAQATKAPLQSLADRIAAVFVPVVVALAAFTFAFHLLGLHQTPLVAMIPGVAVLVVACPCAMGLAAPAAIVAGIGRGARLGVLIRDGVTLQHAASVHTMLLDKTGTLTEGRPTVLGIRETADSTQSKIESRQSQILSLAASVEIHSEHPIGKAIDQAAYAASIETRPSTDFLAYPGKGVEAVVDGHRVTVGTPSFVSQTVDPSFAAGAESKGQTVVAVAIDGNLAGLIAIGDPIRPEAAEAIAEIRAMGIEPVMLTGDRKATALAIAKSAGIQMVEAELLPEDKAESVLRYAKKGPVAMVGDGINDAPALAAAKVGIAIAAGSDIAKETAGIILLRPDLRALPQAIRLARKTTATIRTNLVWAFVYNLAALPIAATGRLDPMIAAAAMALSSLSVLLNSLRLLRFN